MRAFFRFRGVPVLLPAASQCQENGDLVIDEFGGRGGIGAFVNGQRPFGVKRRQKIDTAVTVEPVRLIVGERALVACGFQGGISVQFAGVGSQGAFRFPQGVQNSGVEAGKRGLIFGFGLFDPAARRAGIGKRP